VEFPRAGIEPARSRDEQEAAGVSGGFQGPAGLRLCTDADATLKSLFPYKPEVPHSIDFEKRRLVRETGS